MKNYGKIDSVITALDNKKVTGRGQCDGGEGTIYMQEKSELVFINGNLTAFQCIEQLINPEVISLFVRKPNHVLMQDSARPHMAHLTATHRSTVACKVIGHEPNRTPVG